MVDVDGFVNVGDCFWIELWGGFDVEIVVFLYCFFVD